MTTDAPIPRSLTDLATEALAVQDACNLADVASGKTICLSDMLATGEAFVE